jgi:hypothetical protein
MEERGKRPGWRRYLPENPWTVLIGPLVVALAVAGVTAAVKAIGSSDPAPDLRALEPVVHNGLAESEFLRVGGSNIPASRQSDRSKPRIELRLENTGEKRTYITAAVFTVRKVIAIGPCGAGAGVIVSAKYDVVLPERAAEGQQIEVPINQQIAPDGVDRFVFRVGRNAGSADAGVTHVYQLDIAVLHDGSDEPADAGQVLVAVPGSPRVEDLHLDLPPAQRGCLSDIVDGFAEAARLEGARSPRLDRVLTAAAAVG